METQELKTIWPHYINNNKNHADANRHNSATRRWVAMARKRRNQEIANRLAVSRLLQAFQADPLPDAVRKKIEELEAELPKLPPHPIAIGYEDQDYIFPDQGECFWGEEYPINF